MAIDDGDLGPLLLSARYIFPWSADSNEHNLSESAGASCFQFLDHDASSKANSFQ
jgi:hypothetical protein